ncbi:hypothetical protein ACHAXS_007143 [Conticribra weissflogii]
MTITSVATASSNTSSFQETSQDTTGFTPSGIIAKKRSNISPHTTQEIGWFIRQFMQGNVKDYQMSAWLMAICLNGMNEEETAALTEAMVQSGDVMDWSKYEISGKELPHKVDKHSTGGVGDKVSLILAPLIASFGLIVPMMAGRGLGHTGGTIDKLESIPGFRTQYSADEFAGLLLSNRDNGPLNGAIVSPSSNICPADKRMYALRDVTATVTSIPLQTSSIMSKKIAERPDSLVLDVKFGKGSFNNEVEASLELAKSMIQTGELCGIRTSALVTRMDNVMGCAVGNWLEVKECIDIMTMNTNGKIPECIIRSKDLIEVTLTLAAQMLVQAKKAATLQEGIAMAQDHIISGKCWNKFREMVQAQGGTLRCIEAPEEYPTAKFSVRYLLTHLINYDEPRFSLIYYVPFINFFLVRVQSKVISPKSCFISSIDALEIGIVGVLIGAGRKSVEESVDFSAGISFHVRPGQYVENGHVLATIYTERSAVLANATKSVLNAFGFSDEAVTMPPLIANIVTTDGVREFDHSLLESIKFD